jgi:5-methylcytosine-specific restriction endonuclease McrA
VPKFKQRAALRKGKRRRGPDWRRRRWNITQLLRRERGLCSYCGKQVARDHGPRHATIDHVIAIASGGLDAIDNMVLACATCNNEKDSGVALDVYLEG